MISDAHSFASWNRDALKSASATVDNQVTFVCTECFKITTIRMDALDWFVEINQT